jgi:hypothetical protein
MQQDGELDLSSLPAGVLPAYHKLARLSPRSLLAAERSDSPWMVATTPVMRSDDGILQLFVNDIWAGDDQQESNTFLS